VPWDSYFLNILPENEKGVFVVLHGSCGDHFTSCLDGSKANFLGEGDLHDPHYDHLEITIKFAPFLKYNFSDTHEHCEYDLHLYPSSELEDKYKSSNPFLYEIVVVPVFLLTAITYIVYDHFVQSRQDKLMVVAKRTNAVVSSLSPKNVPYTTES
jgi:hypothetical protein